MEWMVVELKSGNKYDMKKKIGKCVNLYRKFICSNRYEMI